MSLVDFGIFCVVCLLVLAGILFSIAFLFGGKRKNKRNDAAIVQERMPLCDIEGHYAFMKDGSYRAYMLWRGRNQSIDTKDERIAKALIDSTVLGSIDSKFSIVKLPEKINSSHQLNLVDAAIKREEDAFFNSSDNETRELHRMRMNLLSKHMRQDALKESFSSDRMSWSTYLVFYFPAKKDIDSAEQMMNNMLKVAEDVMENPPRYLNEAEIRHFYQLYFTPGTVTDVAAPTGTAVIPDVA